MGKLIAIVGLSATGKTTLASTYKDYEIIHADDFLKYREQAPYHISRIVRHSKDNVVMEGMGIYKYLNDMREYDFRFPDLILNCTAPKDIRSSRLSLRGTLSDNSFAMDNYYLKLLDKFNKSGCGIEGRDVMYMAERQN